MFRSLCIAGMVSASLFAETNKNTIVVTANRMNRSAHETAGGVTVITADQIVSGGVADTVQALERFGGVQVRRYSGNPAQAEVVMRGFGENAHGRVLVLVDGQRLNEPDMQAPNWGRIPVQSIRRIEILHGAQTALYGNYAVAGVINIITRKGEDQAQETSASVTAGSEDTYGTHLHTSGNLGDSQYSADLDWQKSSGWRANSHYENYDARANVSHDWSERLSNYLGVFYNRSEFGLPGSLTHAQFQDDPRQTTTPRDNASGESWGLNTGGKGIFGDWGELSADINLQRRLRKAWYYSIWGDTYNDYAIDSFAFTPKYLLDKDLFGHKNNLVVGLDLGVDTLDYAKTALPAQVRMVEATLKRFNSALYARDEFNITDSLSAAAGLRGEVMRTSIGNDVHGSDTSWQQAYDISFNFRPTDRQKYYLRGSTLYRYPFLDEIASYQGFGADGFNADLDPETGWQLEAGLAVEVLRDVNYELRFFHLELRDEIAYVWPTNENLDQTRRDGLETSVRWNPAKWGSLGLAYQLVQAEFSDGPNNGNAVPLVPSQYLTLDGELNVAYGISLLAAMRTSASQYAGGDIANQSDRIAGYAVFDLGVRYQPHFVKGLDFLFSCDNFLDEDYTNYVYWGGYYPANGRMWRMTAKYAF